MLAHSLAIKAVQPEFQERAVETGRILLNKRICIGREYVLDLRALCRFQVAPACCICELVSSNENSGVFKTEKGREKRKLEVEEL